MPSQLRVAQHLVLGIDRGDRVLQVEDGRERGFHHQVADAGGVAGADCGAAVDDRRSKWMPLCLNSSDFGAAASPW